MLFYCKLNPQILNLGRCVNNGKQPNLLLAKGVNYTSKSFVRSSQGRERERKREREREKEREREREREKNLKFFPFFLFVSFFRMYFAIGLQKLRFNLIKKL
jgi:hypothetical protein